MKKMAKKIVNKVNNDVLLYLLDATNYQKVIIKILKDLVVKKKQMGVYVALNKPYKTLTRFFKNQGIPPEKLFFLDTASQVKYKETNVMNVSPENLTDISVAINKLMNDKKFNFVLFDTVDTFLVYNGKNMTDRFFYDLVSKLRNKNKLCILMGIKDSLIQQMLHVSMSKISDETIDLSKIETPQKIFDKTFLKI